jgi:hypothetical protein
MDDPFRQTRDPRVGADRHIRHLSVPVQRTWMSRTASSPKRRGIRVLTSSTMRATAASGSSACTK